MSALFGAVTVTLAFLCQRQLGVSVIASLIGAATLGASELFWFQAIIAEVYTIGLAAILFVLWLLLVGHNTRKPRMLVVAAGVAGLSLGLHFFIATCGLGYVLLVGGYPFSNANASSSQSRFSSLRLRDRLNFGLAALVATLVGSMIAFSYLPLRAAMQPELNFGNPSGLDSFAWVVSGGRYKDWFLDDYSFFERAQFVAGIIYEQLLVIGLLLSLVGIIVFFKRNIIVALALLLMIVGNMYFFFNYRVHDVEVFFLPSIAILCCFVGIGVNALLHGIARLLDEGEQPRRNAIHRLVTVALLGVPLSLVVVNYSRVDLSHYTDAYRFGETLCETLPHGAMILNATTPPEWKVDAVFSMYFQMVLRKRRDVKVVLINDIGPEVVNAISRRDPVYVYYPLDRFVRTFVLEKEHLLYRIVGFRGAAFQSRSR